MRTVRVDVEVPDNCFLGQRPNHWCRFLSVNTEGQNKDGGPAYYCKLFFCGVRDPLSSPAEACLRASVVGQKSSSSQKG